MPSRGELDGLMVIDKPSGLSSADVVAVIKRKLGVKKAGHTGTLDPFATGVLICGLNSGTKLARFFLKGDKTYRGVLRLGVETDTQDCTGSAIAVREAVGLKEKDIRKAFDRFSGSIEQEPPAYSALKHQGMPLYKLARRGTPVRKSPRRVQIHVLKILAINMPDIAFEVSCSAGTYIRTLGADIGRRLECGGHLKALKRTESCGYTLEDALDLDGLEVLARSGDLHRRIIAPSDALPHMDRCVADKALTEKIKYGRVIDHDDVPPSESNPGRKYLKIVDTDGRLLTILQNDTRRGGAFQYVCVFPKAVGQSNTAEADC